MSWTGWFRSLSLLARFTVASAALTVVTTAVVGLIVGRQIEQSLLEHEAWSVGESVSQALGPVISPSDFEGVSSVTRSAEINRVAVDQLANARMHDLRVWSADGTLIYSPDADMLGYRYRNSAEASRAMQGFPTFTAVTLTGSARTQASGARPGLQTFIPIRARDGAVLGAYEIQHYTDQTVGRIEAMQWLLVGGLLVGFGLLYIALVPVVRKASNQIQLQEHELARLEVQRELSRVGAEFASTVSHEIRAPLTSLVGYSELLLTRASLSGAPQEWAGHVHQQAERLTELVDEILNASIIDEGAARIEREPVDVRAAVTRSVELVVDPASRVTIESRLTPDLPPALADREKLEQVLANLVSNAIKYSPEGGEICVSASVANGALRLSVVDHGIGVEPDALRRIFDRFHRAHTESHPDIPGTGLGLYISRRLVELQGGRMWAESAGPGLGTTVHLELPLAPTNTRRTPPRMRHTFAIGGATH